jgi:ATP-binding cassette, subfamily B, bacterial
MSVLLLPIGLWMPALILVTTLPQAYISLQLQRKGWEIVSGKSFQARRIQYYTSLMLTDTYAKEVRLFKLGPFLTKRFLEAFQDLYKATNHIRWRQAFLSTSLAGLSALGNAFAFYWIVQQALSGKIGPGSVLLLVQAIAYIQQDLAQLVESYGVLYNALLYMEHLFSFLDSKPTMHVPCPGQPIPQPIHSGITFESVHFCYPDGRTALENVSFILHPGETVALVGENGAGKTTIVKLLTRLYDPTAGRIWVDDEMLQNLDLEAWRRQISVVFQDFGRYAFTLGENIALGDLDALNDLESLKNANQKAGLFKLLKKLPKEYQTPLGKQFDGTELSGGEWQKIALARAFLRAEKSQILILDEPTAALDPQSEFDVYQRFADLSRGKTTLLITHRLASVKMADRILVLKDGHLIEEGTHSMLLKSGGEYAKLWNVQAKQYAS